MRSALVATACLVSPVVAAWDFLQDDANTGGDAGNRPADAAPITSAPYQGQLVPVVDTVDFYALPANGSIAPGLHVEVTVRGVDPDDPALCAALSPPVRAEVFYPDGTSAGWVRDSPCDLFASSIVPDKFPKGIWTLQFGYEGVYATGAPPIPGAAITPGVAPAAGASAVASGTAYEFFIWAACEPHCV